MSAAEGVRVGCKRSEDLIYRLYRGHSTFRSGTEPGAQYRNRKTTIPRGQTHWEYLHSYLLYITVCAVGGGGQTTTTVYDFLSAG